MKRLVILAVAAIMAVAFALPSFGFFDFGYTHGIPSNDGKLFAGFDFGPDNSEFNVDAYFGDVWRVSGGKSDLFLGLEAFYVGKAEAFDIEVGAYMESTRLIKWPVVTLADVGFYGDMTIHVVNNESIAWDVFASVKLDATGGALVIDAEIGFEVEL